MKNKRINIIFFFLCYALLCQSQVDSLKHNNFSGVFYTLNTQDNIFIDKKSKTFYDSLSAKLYKSKYTGYISEYLLVKQDTNRTTVNDENLGLQNNNAFKKLSGKRISKINTHAVDLIDGDVRDTSLHTKTLISTTLDNIHIKTRDVILRYNLLFKVGDTLTPYMLSDNERIIRELDYITDAKFYVSLDEKDTNAVNILLVTQDKFSIGSNLGGSSLQTYNISLYDQNFLGYGNRIEGRYYKTTRNENDGYQIEYNANNLIGSFINLNIRYINRNQYDEQHIAFNKPFLTPYTKNIGGFFFQAEKSEHESTSADTVITKSLVNSHTTDFWVGHAFLLKEGERRKNIIISARNSHKKYFQRPYISPDSNAVFYDYTLVLGRIGLQKNRFFKTYNLVQFGVTEDIIFGYDFGVTFGKENKDFFNRYYTGISIALGYYSDKNGYFGSDLQAGTYFNKSSYSDLKIKLKLIYFTPLFKVGSFQYRGIIIPNYNYLKTPHTTVSYPNTGKDIHYFPSYNKLITKKALLTSEHLFFSKWKVIGFKIALLTFFDIGFFNGENKKTFFTKENLYGSTGVGFRVRNEFLSFSSIEVRFNFSINTPDGDAPFEFTYSTSGRTPYYNYQNQRPETVTF